MKFLRAVFLLLFSVPAFGAEDDPNGRLEKAVRARNADAAHQAVRDGATNVDSILIQQLKSENFDYKIVKILADNRSGDVDGSVIDKLYANFIRENCLGIARDKSHESFLEHYSDFVPYGYRLDDRAFRETTDKMAFLNDDEERVACIVKRVANYGGNQNFLKIALESAEKYKSENLKKVILLVQSEIEKQKSEQGLK
jgi:hypothetical protein